MASSVQPTLAIPGYQGSGPRFFARKFVQTIDARMEQYEAARRLTKGKFYCPPSSHYTQRAYDAGRLLVPHQVIDKMRYTAMVHGYGMQLADMPSHNALWDEVTDNGYSPSDFIKANEDDGGGYMLGCSAYELKHSTLAAMLIKDQYIGQEFRNNNWTVIYEGGES